MGLYVVRGCRRRPEAFAVRGRRRLFDEGRLTTWSDPAYLRSKRRCRAKG